MNPYYCCTAPFGEHDEHCTHATNNTATRFTTDIGGEIEIRNGLMFWIRTPDNTSYRIGDRVSDSRAIAELKENVSHA